MRAGRTILFTGNRILERTLIRFMCRCRAHDDSCRHLLESGKERSRKTAMETIKAIQALGYRIEKPN